MNRKQYNSDTRYEKVLHNMDLLGIMDITTTRQHKNGTIVWRLPIKYSTHPKFIEVASFATGYVRNQNGGYTNYQLNKRCESEPQYYPEYKWCDDKDCNVKTGKFLQYTTRACVLIPNEIDRLEYLIGYCLKNYYIKKANEVINGRYVSKWEHEYKLERNQNKMGEICHINANHEFVVNELQNKLANSVPTWKYKELEDRIYELEDSLESSDLRNKIEQGLLENNSKDHATDLKAQINMLQDKLKSVIRTARH